MESKVTARVALSRCRATVTENAVPVGNCVHFFGDQGSRVNWDGAGTCPAPHLALKEV